MNNTNTAAKSSKGMESLYLETKRILEERYVRKLKINDDLARQIVSFQANKKQPFYRWLKFKEGFSSRLVEHFLNEFYPKTHHAPRILDPFAGSGTTLTTSSRLGWRATGIELLPVGTAAMKARLKADNVSVPIFEDHVRELQSVDFRRPNSLYTFPHLRITSGAFTSETEVAIGAFLEFTNRIQDADIKYLFWFACLSILEEISFTRKDGQYLRWDKRSGRKLKSSFDKGKIFTFRDAILNKLEIMLADIRWRNGGTYSSNVNIVEASSLEVLPTLTESSFDLVLTSPPYCNRYDYTRTYALELAFLQYDEHAVKSLRQALLSATVENKSKRTFLQEQYASRNQETQFLNVVKAFENQNTLQSFLHMMNHWRDQGKLNNSNLPSMVENYFFEMCCIIHEMSRVLVTGGRVVMVNDNVQYQGQEIPVDLILSEFAESAGLTVDAIWILPRGKGNSSQQMGVHGRKELRKCVYVWSKRSKANNLRVFRAKEKE